MFGEAKI